ncbi:hypothetical protein [Agrococcus sp. DT81.2]|uniref:hypothetical protein n=1 Tax=Agrococcus sp. DT81.2 TaxID=3393414 RepID=UPI003CE4DE66
MIDIHDPSRPTDRRSAGTSPSAWALVLTVAVALLCLRIPSFVAVAATAVAEQAAALGDADLSAAAVAVGAISAVAIHVLLLGLGALLATLLERALGPGAIAARALGGRFRVGVGGLTFAAIVLGLQVAALALGVAAVERSWPVWLGAAVVALLAPAAFPVARASVRAYARALLASCGTAVLLCAG